MPLIALNGVGLSFAGSLILDSIHLQIEEGERIGLLGRNGVGKSSLLQLLDSTLKPDGGEIARQPGLEVASLRQDVPLAIEGSVREHLLEACHHSRHDRPWEVETAIDRALTDLRLKADAPVATLSAGSKRRVLLAAALVAEPNLLTLDEPTNHLDIETIAQLERVLLRRAGATIFVTHDRAFLRRLATRILDLDRGKLRSYSCSYPEYLERREAEIEVEATQNDQFDKKLAQEEEWVRGGIKARRTRNEGRVRALLELREERRARREAPGRVTASLQEAERSGKIVIRCREADFSYPSGDGSASIVRGFTSTIMRGDRIGLIGPNGCGKTTLIKLLLGALTPTAGSIEHGARVKAAHFDQLHDILDESKTVSENIGEGRDVVKVGGANRHVVGYLRDFLFTREQIQGPVQKLSGGEKKRLQMAEILSRPCNLLVLDEPTNDLDLETLELMENLLVGFEGTLILVSHDREFLDNVVTSTLVFEGEGRWQEYAGGYEDWLRQRKTVEEGSRPKGSQRKREGGAAAEPRRSPRPRKLGYKESRELDGIPDAIERLEAEKERLFAKLASPETYTGTGEAVVTAKTRLDEVEKAIESAYARWEELENLREKASSYKRLPPSEL